MYRNLSRGLAEAKESIHLESWPECDDTYLNTALVFEMDVVQHVVGLGRSAREESRVKVRQPLSRILVRPVSEHARNAITKHEQQILEELNIKAIEFIAPDAQLVNYAIKPDFPKLGKRYGKLMPAIKSALAQADGAAIAMKVAENQTFSIEVDGTDIELAPDDVQIQTSSAQGFASSEGEGYLVALDTSLSNELVQEGLAREIIRTVQDARKSAGLEISDRIHLCVEGSDNVMAAIATHQDYVKSETLTESIKEKHEIKEGFEVNRVTDDANWTITLIRAH